MSERMIKPKFPGKCRVCSRALTPEMSAMFDPDQPRGKKMRHVSCSVDGAGLPQTDVKDQESLPTVDVDNVQAVASGIGTDDLAALAAIIAKLGGANLDRAAVTKIVAEEIAKVRLPVDVVVHTPDSPDPVVVTGAHCRFPTLLAAVNAGAHVMLVGPPGTGKSHAAHMAATSLARPFYAISVGPQTMQTDLLGYRSPTGEVVRTVFRDWFEHGGVFCMDEIDAGSPDVLVVLNSALANGVCAFPDGMITRHATCVLIATANTDGTGRTDQFVGRNQLDAATLDRFFLIDWPIDDSVEAAMCPDATWLAYVRKVRKALEGTRAIVSPRASRDGARMLAAGIARDEVIRGVILRGLSDEAQAIARGVRA